MEVLVFVVVVAALGVVGTVAIVGLVSLHWHQAEIPPLEALAWMVKGFDRDRAAAWRAVPIAASPDRALVWSRAGLEPEDARWFSDRGATVESALAVQATWAAEPLPFRSSAEWAWHGFAAGEQRPWADLVGPDGEGVSPADARAWCSLGLDASGARPWVSVGIRPQVQPAWSSEGCDAPTAGALLAAGIGAEHAVAWLTVVPATHVADWTRFLGDRPDLASAWIHQGLSADESARWSRLGFSPTDAGAWHGHGFEAVEQTAEWRSHFPNAAEAATWMATVHDPTLAASFRDAGIEAEVAAAWVTAGFDASTMEAWAPKGFTPSSAHEWRAKRFDAETATAWREAGFEPRPASDWSKLKVGSSAAATWRDADFTPKTAKLWVRAEAKTAEAQEWLARFDHASDALGWRRVGFDPSSAATWAEHFQDPTIAQAFADRFVPPEVAARWHLAQIDPGDVGSWTKFGFEPEDAQAWAQAKFAPDSARSWLDLGWSAEDSALWRSAGFDPADADVWRRTEQSAARAAAFRTAGFRVDDPEHRPWIQTPLSAVEARARQRTGLQASDATKPLTDVVIDLELSAAAALLLDLGMNLPEHQRSALEHVAAMDGTDAALVRATGALMAIEPGAGRALARLEAVGCGQHPALSPAYVADAGRDALDDIIELGQRPKTLLRSAADHMAGDGDPYGLARLAPGSLDDAQLAQVEHHDELARRLLLSGNGFDPDDFPPSPFIDRLSAIERAGTGDLDAWRDHPPTKAACVAHRGPRTAADLDVLGRDRSLWSLVASAVADLVVEQSSSLELEGPAVQLVEWSLAQVTRSHFRDWDWTGAAVLGKRWVEWAQTPDSEAEARNCLAAAQAMLGRQADADRSLEQAISGSKHHSLLVNRAVLLRDTDPAASIEALAAASAAAPKDESIMLAVEAAQQFAARGDGVPGPSVKAALRRCAVQPTSLEDHHFVMRLLVDHDRAWVADERHTRSSPHERSWEHRVCIAKAKGLDEFVTCLGRAAGDPTEPAWAEDERRAWVGDVFDAMKEDDDDAGWAPQLALLMVEKGFAQDPGPRALLTCVAVRRILTTFTVGEDDPVDRLADLLKTVRGELRRSSFDGREALQTEVSDCLDLFVMLRTAAVRSALLDLARAHDQLVEQFNASGGGWSARRSLRTAAAPLAGPIRDLEQMLKGALELATDPELRSDVRELSESARSLGRSCEEMAS